MFFWLVVLLFFSLRLRARNGKRVKNSTGDYFSPKIAHKMRISQHKTICASVNSPELVQGKFGPGRLGPSPICWQIGPWKIGPLANWPPANWAPKFFWGKLGPGKLGPCILGPCIIYICVGYILPTIGGIYVSWNCILVLDISECDEYIRIFEYSNIFYTNIYSDIHSGQFCLYEYIRTFVSKFSRMSHSVLSIQACIYKSN